MKQQRNPEYRNELIIYIIVTVVAAGICLIFSWQAAVAVAAIGLIFCVIHYIFGKRRYKKIAELSESIDRILHGQEDILISSSDEGELAILSSEVHKMTVRLKEQADLLMSDKVRLTTAIEDIFHQLRTPLTSMNLVVSLLAEENLSYEKRLSLTHELRRQLERMQWLVETMLKMSKIDAGTALFRQEDIPLSEIIKDSSEPFLVALELKGVEFKANDCGASLRCDKQWTVEAISNLIKNCMEHTPEGGSVCIETADTAISTDIVITDSGEGFTADDLQHVFERFYKGKNATEGSIGIGLAFARSVITAQNGTITAQNAAGGGAQFRIKFYKSIV